MNRLDFRICSECRCQHTHGHPQILMPLKETLRIWIGDCEYYVSPRELCFIPPDMLHRCQFLSSLLVINIPRSMVDQKDIAILSYPLIVSLQDQMMQLVNLIRTEIEQNPGSKAVYYLYSYLYSKLIENCSTASMRYICEHYDQPITVTQLAELENYNVTYFNDWFKELTGFPPSLYLRNVRISKAKELLEATGFSIMEIAAMVGYSSNSTLTRAFHSLTGITPKEYRDRAVFAKTG